MVALYHFPATGWIETNSIINNSRMFVDFFFVLSGFVIAANYTNRLETPEQARKFMWLRIGRLYPLHVAILLAFVGYEVVKLAFGQDDAFLFPNDTASLAQNALLIHGLGTTSELTWNWPSWSISTEMAAYLLSLIHI